MKNSVKLISVLLCLVMVLAACAPAAPVPAEPSAPVAEPPAPAYTGGTFEGVGQGLHGDIKVALTIDADQKITDVKVLEQNETVGVADLALERIPADMVKYQTVVVDAVAGATMTSDGLMEAAKKALEASGADVAKLSQAANASGAAGQNIEKTADVVVVGAGGAGLAAAVAAKQNGASVIVVEKMPKVGGNTIISGAAYNTRDATRQASLPADAGPEATVQNLISAEPASDLHKQLQQTLKQEYDAYKKSGSKVLFDSPTLHALQTFEGGDRVGNLELIIDYTNKTLPGIEWLQSLGMGFTDTIFTVLGALWPRSHRPEKPLGTGYIETLADVAAKNGIEILLDTKANEIIMENGRACGIVATALDGSTVTIKASKGVVMAAGGFGKNVEMRQSYNKQWKTLDETILSTNHPGATGDGIVMGEKVGANLVGMNYIQLLPMGDPVTGSLSGNIEQGVEDRIFVNKEGNRFVAEDARRDVMTEALYQQTDAYMWVIVDKHSYPTGDTKNNFNETIDQLVEAGRAYKADTLEDLAKQINIPAENFVKAVEAFNKNVETKAKDEFGRTLYQHKIDTPPYYAGARVPTVHHTMGGLEIDLDCRVLNTSGQVIPGLYAAGEVTGGIHGSNRLGGNALPDIIVHGKIAGESAAQGK